MYRFNAEDPGQSLYTPTTVGVIINSNEGNYARFNERLNHLFLRLRLEYDT